MTRSSRTIALWALTAAALLLAWPAAAQTAVEALPKPPPEPIPEEEPGLISFVPQPDAVFLEKTGSHPELGDTRVILAMGDAELERLAKETNRTDLLAVGPDGQQVVFRDDGNEGDLNAGDLEFTALATIDAAEVADRAEADQTSQEKGETRGVPVFESRALVGEASTEPFDAAAFEAGQRVKLNRSLSTAGANADAAAVLDVLDGGLRSLVAAMVVPGTNQFQDRVLMIRDVAVVTDPARTFDACTNTGTQFGPWTFGHLMTEMANQTASGINPSTFTENWLNHWLTNQTINSFNVPSRTTMQALINDWRNASGGGALNLGIAPFRLLAINPRIDLRTTVGGTGGYGGTANGAFLDAGEARITFGIVLPQSYTQSRPLFIGSSTIPNSNNCLATRFSVIFEYRVPKCKCEDVRAWARSWRRLNNFTPGSNIYNGLLERLTRTFTDRNRNPTRPNRAAIGQVRTNEVGLAIPWEIREFQLRMMPWSFLLETTTADSPDDSFNNTTTFGNFVLDTINGVTGPAVPLMYPLGSGQNFLGANPQTPNPFATFWNAPNLNVVNPPEDLGRHLASLGTCNGCHARETDTIFQHIESFNGPLPAVISGFLTGITVIDPVSGTSRDFDDLARREVDINAVAKMICARFRPVKLSAVRILPVLGPAQSGLQALAAPATTAVETDPDGAPLSVAPEDFLRHPIQQVH